MDLILKRYSILTALLILSLFAAIGCSTDSNKTELTSSVLIVKYDSLMHSIVIPKVEGADNLMKDYSASEKLVLGADTLANFNLIDSHYIETDSSKKLILNSLYDKDNIKIEKSVSLEILNDYPSFVIKNVTYKNLSPEDIEITGWINDQYQILPDKNNNPAYWSYQSGTYPDRRDWVTEVNAGFEQENYLGMNASDYGGGTPIVDVWRSDVGLAVGHLEKVPKLVSLPVVYKKNSEGVVLAVNYIYLEPVALPSGKSIKTFETFINVHTGDHYSSLKQFSKIMTDKGLAFHNYPETSYEPIWCAWGYERNFTVEVSQRR
jgi:alpha-galactosidase